MNQNYFAFNLLLKSDLSSVVGPLILYSIFQIHPFLLKFLPPEYQACFSFPCSTLKIIRLIHPEQLAMHCLKFNTKASGAFQN